MSILVTILALMLLQSGMNSRISFVLSLVTSFSLFIGVFNVAFNTVRSYRDG